MTSASFACPCCGDLALTEQPPGTYQICPLCGGEDDPVPFAPLARRKPRKPFADASFAGGANRVSLKFACSRRWRVLNEARAQVARLRAVAARPADQKT